MREEVVDASAATIVAVANKVTWGSAATSFAAALVKIDMIAWLGILIALCGLLVQWYYRHQENKRDSRQDAIDEEIKRLKLERMRKGQCDDDE